MDTTDGHGTGSGEQNPAGAEGKQPFSLVIVNGGTGDPSSTRRLTDRIGDRLATLAGDHGQPVTTSVIDARDLATEITTAVVSGLQGTKLAGAVELLNAADGIIAGSPVYKAEASGLFSSFFQVLDNDLLIAKPVILAATAESERHALVVDDQMRPLFAYLRTLVVPTSIFAAPQDWADAGFNQRIDRAATELLLLMESGFAQQVKGRSWHSYQHEYGSAGGTELSIDLESDLMQLATGGSANGRGLADQPTTS